MNLEEYEKFGCQTYEALSIIVRNLLERAIESEQGYRPQQIQHRAKTIVSLTRRLEQLDALASDEIEDLRKDLAGCRLVFYTNNDVNRFAGSGILRELFEIDWDRSKFHHPKPVDQDATLERRSPALNFGSPTVRSLRVCPVPI